MLPELCCYEMHLICNLVTHIDLQRLLLLFYMQSFTKVDNHHLLPTEGYEVLFLPNHPGVGEHRYKKAWLYMGSFPHPRHIFAAAQENKDLRSPFRGPSSLLTNIFCADP